MDDERPPESDAEAERIAEMRARMEAMFGGGEAPAPEPPAPEPPAAEAPPEPAPPAAADDDDAAMRARMDALFGGGGDSAGGGDTTGRRRGRAERRRNQKTGPLRPPEEEPRARRADGRSGRRALEVEGSARHARGPGTIHAGVGPAGWIKGGPESEGRRRRGAARRARDGVAPDLAEAARHACDATVAAVLEGKRKVLIEARVEGLDPAQKTIDGSAVLAWSKNALSRLPYDNLVLLDAAGTTRLAEEAGITAEPLLLNFGQANEEETPESTLYVVFAPFSNDDMVATRRVFRAAAFKNLPVVVLNHRHDEPGGAEPPREYFDATEAYCLRPLMVRGGTPPVRVVVSRATRRPTRSSWISEGGL